MKTILTIGYNHYLLPDSVNVQSLLKSICGMVELEKKHIKTGEGYEEVYFSEKPPKIEIAVVENRHVLSGKRKLIPQQAGQDCHGEGVPL